MAAGRKQRAQRDGQPKRRKGDGGALNRRLGEILGSKKKPGSRSHSFFGGFFDSVALY
jgi:hypothetical protein